MILQQIPKYISLAYLIYIIFAFILQVIINAITLEKELLGTSFARNYLSKQINTSTYMKLFYFTPRQNKIIELQFSRINSYSIQFP